MENNKTAAPLSDYEQYKASQNAPVDAEQSDYAKHKASLNSEEVDYSANPRNESMIDVGFGYMHKGSKAVQPVYQKALNKIDSLFDSSDETSAPENKKISIQDKATMLGISAKDIAGYEEKSIDRLLSRKRTKDAAVSYPDYVNNADKKSIDQLFTNPEAVKQINNSAKARAMKANTFEKFVATNKASALSMVNTLKFLAPDGDFEEWAKTHAVLSAERKANTITSEGTPKLNKMWEVYQPFSNSPTSFYDIAKYVTTDPEGFMAAFSEASNSAVSIALSIGGRTAGMGVGLAGGPAGVIAGGQIGAFMGGAIAAGDEFIQNEIDTNYTSADGTTVNYKALKADIGKIKTKWQIEYGEHGLIGGAAEMFAPKIFKGIGNKLSKVLPSVSPNKVPKFFKTATVKALAKAGKFTGKVGVKGGEEFVGEALSSFAPKTMIDFQNGRLDKNKLLANAKEGFREAVSGLITASAMAPVTLAVESAIGKKSDAITPDVMDKKESTSKSKPETKTYNAESKPFNERTTEENADSAYKTEQAEITLELSEHLDNDTDAAEMLEGMTDYEKVALVDSANTASSTDEDGVVTEGTPTETIVNGADIGTLLGDDVSLVQEVMLQERQVELAQAIESGENFKFTYGEWVVAASKLKDKYPTINHLPINPETESTGYEAVSHVSDMYDLMQAHYDISLNAPALESTPPSTPGISAEITADSNPAAISSRKQTGIVKEVTPTGNINQVTLKLVDGSEHTIDLYDKESAVDIQGIADKLATQFAKALKSSGRTTDTVQKASLQGIPVIMRVLIKRAKALGKPISDMAKGITFKSDASAGSAYIGSIRGSDQVVYGVGRAAQEVSTVAHEFAHAILHYMTVDFPIINAQKQAGTITPEGLEYLGTMNAAAKLLGLKDISEVNDDSSDTLVNPKTGVAITRNQSRGILTKRTIHHEKMATTMEVFLKEGKLETETMETEMAQILLYWRGLIPSDVLSHKASVAATEGWNAKDSGEYYQALDATAEVGHVFHGMYAVNQQIDKTTVPMFNFSFFPVEILGKGGQLILDKVIAAKHIAIAKVFAKVYADSINARNAINTPQAIANMNKDLVDTFAATRSGELVADISALGIRIPESMSKSLNNIQELMQRYNSDAAPFYKDATLADIEVLLEDNTDAIDDGENAMDVVARIVQTFDKTKVDVYNQTLEDLGYVTDDKIKQASEEMLAKALPSILNDQFTQIVAAYPAEAKQLFAAFIRNGKVSSRMAHKHVTIAAQNKLDAMDAEDLRTKSFIKGVHDISVQVVNTFNQGKYIEALGLKYTELIESQMLHLSDDLSKKVKSAMAATKLYGSLDYVNAHRGAVHPEAMQYLRDVLNNIAAKTPVEYTKIEKLDPDLNLFVNDTTLRLLEDIAGKKLTSVYVQLALGQYATTIARVAAAARKFEIEAAEFVTSERINNDKVVVLNSTKVWDMNSLLPQANSVHEVFTTYFKSEQDYWNSGIADQIYQVINGEAKSTNMSSEVLTRIKKFSKKSLSKKFDPITLPLSGLVLDSRPAAVCTLLLMGSASGRSHLLNSHGLVNVDTLTNTVTTKDAELQQDIENLIAQGVITVDDINLTNALWAEMVPILEMIKEVYRRDKGIQVGEIKAVPFEVGGHKMTGGYFPISYNEVSSIGDADKEQSAFYSIFNLSTFKNTKERGESAKGPVKLGLGIIDAYINMAMRENYIIPPMRLFEAFVTDPEVKAHIEMTRPGALEEPTRIGPNIFENGIINDWISDVKNQARSDMRKSSSKVLRSILKNTSLVFYSTDPISAATNYLAGLPAAIPYSSSKMRIALKLATSPISIFTKSKTTHLSDQMMANERQFVQWVLTENTEELYSKMTTAKEFATKAAMFLQRVLQYNLERTIWEAEYESQKANGLTTSAAVKRADLVTERVLGRYALSNKSMGQKAGELGMITNIATPHLFAFKRHHNIELQRDSAAWRRVFMTGVVAGGAILSVAVALTINDLATPDRPKETEEDKEMRMKLQVASEMLPYYFGPYGRVMSGIINSTVLRSDISISPIEHTLKKVGRGAYTAATAWGTDFKPGARDYADVWAALTMFTGYPYSSIANANDFLTALRFSEHDKIAIKRLKEDAERSAYSRQFMNEYNPFID